MIFKNEDIISGEELVGYGIVSGETENRLLNLKKLRKLNNIYYIWDYDEDFKKLIFSYKYHRKKKLAKLIADMIKKEFEFVIQREKIDFVISVPVNIQRKNERGYNQVDEILKCLDIKYIQLKRIKNTDKMHKLLDEKLRRKNIEGPCSVGKNIDFKNKRILIVDDIITTGATLREIKKSILEKISDKENINKNKMRNNKIDDREKNYRKKYYEEKNHKEENYKKENLNKNSNKYETEIIVFCLAAAREIRISKGEI